MKTKSLFLFLAFFFFISFFEVNGQSSLFTGDWKLDREKTQLQGSQLFLSKIKVAFKNDTLRTERVYETSSGEEYPFTENISLNGKDCKIIVYDMPRSSKATLSAGVGSVNVESVTTFNGANGEDNNKTSEVWKVDEAGKILTMTFTTSTSAGSVSGTLFFNKIN
jgi:hypothetical protein